MTFHFFSFILLLLCVTIFSSFIVVKATITNNNNCSIESNIIQVNNIPTFLTITHKTTNKMYRQYLICNLIDTNNNDIVSASFESNQNNEWIVKSTLFNSQDLNSEILTINKNSNYQLICYNLVNTTVIKNDIVLFFSPNVTTTSFGSIPTIPLSWNCSISPISHLSLNYSIQLQPLSIIPIYNVNLTFTNVGNATIINNLLTIFDLNIVTYNIVPFYNNLSAFWILVSNSTSPVCNNCTDQICMNDTCCISNYNNNTKGCYQESSSCFSPFENQFYTCGDTNSCCNNKNGDWNCCGTNSFCCKGIADNTCCINGQSCSISTSGNAICGNCPNGEAACQGKCCNGTDICIQDVNGNAICCPSSSISACFGICVLPGEKCTYSGTISPNIPTCNSTVCYYNQTNYSCHNVCPSNTTVCNGQCCNSNQRCYTNGCGGYQIVSNVGYCCNNFEDNGYENCCFDYCPLNSDIVRCSNCVFPPIPPITSLLTRESTQSLISVSSNKKNEKNNEKLRRINSNKQKSQKTLNKTIEKQVNTIEKKSTFLSSFVNSVNNNFIQIGNALRIGESSSYPLLQYQYSLEYQCQNYSYFPTYTYNFNSDNNNFQFLFIPNSNYQTLFYFSINIATLNISVLYRNSSTISIVVKRTQAVLLLSNFISISYSLPIHLVSNIPTSIIDQCGNQFQFYSTKIEKNKTQKTLSFELSLRQEKQKGKEQKLSFSLLSDYLLSTGIMYSQQFVLNYPN